MMSQKSESFFNRQQAYIKKVKENMSKIGKIQMLLSLMTFFLGVTLGYLSTKKSNATSNIFYPWYGVGVWSSILTFIASLRALYAAGSLYTGAVIHVHLVFAAIALFGEFLSCALSSYIAYQGDQVYFDVTYQVLLIALAVLEFISVYTMIKSALLSTKISTCRLDPTIMDQLTIHHIEDISSQQELY